MTKTEIKQMQAAAQMIPASVKAWSHGFTSSTLTVSVAPNPLRTVHPYVNPGTVMVTADDARPELDRLAAAGTFDSVLLIWKTWSAAQDLKLPYWGLSEGLDQKTGAEIGSATFIKTDIVTPWYEQVLIHEWLHGVVDYYARTVGYSGPEPDDGGKDGYKAKLTREKLSFWNDWAQFYSDLMTGRVHTADGKTLGGITKALWQSGSSTSKSLFG
jgi:hypothetical protein